MLEISLTNFTWISLSRGELSAQLDAVQQRLHALSRITLFDLDLSNLLGSTQSSHFSSTADYSLLVFRRLVMSSEGASDQFLHLDTSPVAFIILDRVILSIHPESCAIHHTFVQRLKDTPTNRQPTSPADLMLRIVNPMVDTYLELRHGLSKSMAHWQMQLLSPRKRFHHWDALLAARMRLHHVEDICEDQRASVQEWIDELDTWATASAHATVLREHDLLMVRSRDVLEHIERVAHHVRRLEQTLEASIQIHFSIQGNHTNDIMRTLTALTAIFLPLNLVTGFFGMNFEFLPLIHRGDGLWWAIGTMVTVTTALVCIFLRKRYLAKIEP